MSTRLYPYRWGSGNKPFEGTFVAKPLSAATGDFSEFEGGDKIVLPEATLRDVKRLRLPFPLLFEVSNAGRRSKGGVMQLAGCIEFSAPTGVCYLPSWMMENLKLRPGGKLLIKSRFDVKKGKSCQLQPHSSEFCELAASIGVRDILEQTMRHYSALTKGETFKINWFDQEFYFDVVKVSPGTAITLYGNLDLEVDLEVPLGDGKGRVRKTPRKRASAAAASAGMIDASGAEKKQPATAPVPKQSAGRSASERKPVSRESASVRRRAQAREKASSSSTTAKKQRSTGERRKQSAIGTSGSTASGAGTRHRSRPKAPTKQRDTSESLLPKEGRSSKQKAPRTTSSRRAKVPYERQAARARFDEEKEKDEDGIDAMQKPQIPVKEVSEQSKSRFKAMLMNAHTRGDGQIMHTDEDGERHAIENPNLGADEKAKPVPTPLAEAVPEQVVPSAEAVESSSAQALSAEDAKENEPETVESHFEKLAGTGRSLGASAATGAGTKGSTTAKDGSGGMRDVLARAAAARMARLKRFEGGATGARDAGASVLGDGGRLGGVEKSRATGAGISNGSSNASGGNTLSTGSATAGEGMPLGDRNAAAPSKTATRFARRKVKANFRGNGRALAN